MRLRETPSADLMVLIACTPRHTLHMRMSKRGPWVKQMKETQDFSALFLQLLVNAYLLQNRNFEKHHEKVSTCLAVALPT